MHTTSCVQKSDNPIYLKLIKLWLVSVLVILPFQNNIADYLSMWGSKSFFIIPYIDELTIIIFSLLSFGEYYRRRTFPVNFFLIFPLIIFGICGLTSGFLNGNPLQATALGIFDYIKSFLLIFIYAAFFRDFSDFNKIFRILLIIALVLGLKTLLEFTWAMGSVYVLGKDITDPGVYIFLNSSLYSPDFLNTIIWRYGIFRSLSYSYNLGLYSLLMLTILFSTKKLNTALFIPLIAGIIASVSRMVYAGLIFVMTIQAFKKRRWIIPLILLISLVSLLLINSYDLDLNDPRMLETAILDKTDPENIRPYTRYKSLEIWQDQPVWGVGPGMFGGIVASKFNSPVYSDYNLINKNYLINIGGIEQFWFQLIAEMGIVGFLTFTSFIAALFIRLFTLSKNAETQNMRDLFSALGIFIFCILIYCLGSGINISPVMFTYCAFVGIALGSYKERPGE